MNLKRDLHHQERPTLNNKFQMLLMRTTSKLYTKRDKKKKQQEQQRAFNSRRHDKCDVSNSNSTSGTLVASPLLDTTKLDDSRGQFITSFDYEYLEKPKDRDG